MITQESKLFFICFFLAILCSIALTYNAIYIQGNFTTFTEDNVPDPTDVYYVLWDVISPGSQ